jgi:hypothetical protein
MKFVKRTLIGLLLLLSLVAGIVFIALTFYKKELTKALIDELRVKHGLTLLVEDVNVSFKNNWPHVSAQLVNVSISSNRNEKTMTPFLRAGELAVSFNLVKLLNKQFIVKYVSLKDVNLNLIKFADGTKNFEITQSKDSTQIKSAFDLNIDKVTFKNVKFQFVNEARGQKIGLDFSEYVIRLKNYVEGLAINMKGDVFIRGLLFNPNAGEFLTKTKVTVNFDGAYFENDKQVCVHPPSFVLIDENRYSVSSIIDLSDFKRLFLVIERKGVKSGQVANYLTPKIKQVLSNFKMKHPLDVKFLMVARLGVKEEPVIIADIVGKECDLRIGNSKIHFSNLNFKCRVLSLHQNRKRGDMDHAKLVFNSIKGKIYDFPFTAELSVFDLPKACIDLKASIVLDGKSIKRESLKNVRIKGTGLASIQYSGSARNLNKENFLNDSMNLNAYLVFTNLAYKKWDSDLEFILNGKAKLDRQNLHFENLGVKTAFGDLKLKGKSENFLKYIIGLTNVCKARINARSERIDLNPLFTGNQKKKKSKSSKGNSDLWSGSIFDIDLNLNTSQLLFRKIATKKAEINLNYKNELISISQFHLHACEGEINVRGTLKNLSKIQSIVTIKNVDATQLFEQFENFGQEAVKSENIKGKIFLEGNFSAELDQEKNFKGESVASDISVKVKEGHLINFEPLQNISNFVLKQKDFKDVSFSELNETLMIRGFEIKINELEIASSVLNLYVVNGLYGIKANSNINMLIPWSNLKRLGSNSIPKISGQSAENTKGLKLNYSGPPNKMKLSFGHKEQEQRFW